MYVKLIGKLNSNKKAFKISSVKSIFITLIIVWIFIELLHTLSSYLYTKIMPKFQQYIRNIFVKKIFEGYETNFEELKLGDVITKIIKLPYIFEEIFDSMRDFILGNLIILISSGCYLLYYNKYLGLTYIISMGVIFIICYFYSTKCDSLIKESEIKYDLVHEEIEDTFSNLISIFTSKRQKHEQNRINKYNTNILNADYKMHACNQKFRIIYTVVFILIFIILNWLSLYLY